MEFLKNKITSQEFIGRKNELGKLNEIVKKSSKGICNLLLIEGESGIGKTRLISELIKTGVFGYKE